MLTIFYQVICFVVCRKVIELNDVEKIVLDDVINFQAAGLDGQVVVVRGHQSNRTENRFDFGSERNQLGIRRNRWCDWKIVGILDELIKGNNI